MPAGGGRTGRLPVGAAATPALCLLAAGLAFAPSPAAAGAWTWGQGQGLAILQAEAVASSSAFGPDFGLYTTSSYDKVEVNLVLEYGATDWLTLIAAPQFLAVRVGEPDASSYDGPGYVDFGARVRLWQSEGAVVSAQVVARAPGAASSASAAALGYADWELDMRLLAGTSFTLMGLSAFADLEVAQRQRFGDLPDEFRFDVTLGLRIAPRWQVVLQSFNVISEGAGEGPCCTTSYEYYKAQAGLLYDWSASLTLQAALVTTYFARNAPQENGVVLAALYHF